MEVPSCWALDGGEMPYLIPRPSQPQIFECLQYRGGRHCHAWWHHVDRGRHTEGGTWQRSSKPIFVMSILGLEGRAFTGHHQYCSLFTMSGNGNYYGWTLPLCFYLNVIACDQVSQALSILAGTAWNQPNKCNCLSSYAISLCSWCKIWSIDSLHWRP